MPRTISAPSSERSQAERDFDLLVGDALERTQDAGEAWCVGLPVPVRYRAAGAVRAWEVARRAAGRAGSALTAALSDVRQPPTQLFELVVDFITDLTSLDMSGHNGERLTHLCGSSAYWQAFWLRGGALYEPTPALHRMLDVTDVAENMPLRMIRPPLPAMCIVPIHSGGSGVERFDAVTVFSHAIPNESGSAKRGVTLVVQVGQRVDVQIFVIDDGCDDTAMQAMDDSIAQVRARGDLDAQELDRVAARVHHALEYTIKVLLYLAVDDAQCVQELPYSAAPKSFPGLGKRKREMRLAEVENLYDRYLIGPTVLADELPGMTDSSAGHSVSAHWRRGHFRLQPHGPQASLRKVMFIRPTVVRADRLMAAEAIKR